MAGICADHGPAGSGTTGPIRWRIRASITAEMSRAPARSRSADRIGQDLCGVEPGEFGGTQGAPQPFRLVARLGAVAGRQGDHDQVLVALVTGGGGLGGPDRVQQGQVIRVSQGLVPGLGGGVLLAVALQHGGQDGERLPCSGGGLAAGAGGEPVVAGQLGGRPRPGDRVRAFRGEREDVGDVDVGTAGQGDVGVRAVLGAGDQGQAGVDGAALGGVIGDRVAEFGIVIGGEQELLVGPAALAGVAGRRPAPGARSARRG